MYKKWARSVQDTGTVDKNRAQKVRKAIAKGCSLNSAGRGRELLLLGLRTYLNSVASVRGPVPKFGTGRLKVLHGRAQERCELVFATGGPRCQSHLLSEGITGR